MGNFAVALVVISLMATVFHQFFLVMRRHGKQGESVSRPCGINNRQNFGPVFAVTTQVIFIPTPMGKTAAFFYGTLMHPKILKNVLRNDGSHLELCPAVLFVSGAPNNY
jgi:hypothetical protein